MPTVIIYDGADRTDYRDTDAQGRLVSIRSVAKPGSDLYNRDALTTRASAAIADCNTAETLLNANGWDGLTPAQRKAIGLGLVQDVRALIRLTLNLLDSPS